MVSFYRVLENIQLSKEKTPKDGAMSAIRTGIGIRDDFWDDFLALINNTAGVSQLLGVSEIKIAEWHAKIEQALSKVKDADTTPETKDNTKLLKTGDSISFGNPQQAPQEQ